MSPFPGVDVLVRPGGHIRDSAQRSACHSAGREFGVTRERIRQIEAKTLAKLRHPQRSQRLREFLEAE